MFTIVVEDGSGLVTANAYASVAEVDNYLSLNIHATAWALLEDATKEKLIMWATQILDTRVKWHGTRTHETQGLAWPRSGVLDRERSLIEDDIVPDAVKLAVATLANHLITGDPTEVDTASNITMLQADVVQLKFDTKADVSKYPDALSYILRGLGYVSMGRGGPKRIVKH